MEELEIAAGEETRQLMRPRLAVGIVAACLVLALVPVALNWRSGPSRGDLAHFDRDGLAFDYPASWHTTVSGMWLHYWTILYFVGTGSGSGACTTFPLGSGEFVDGCGPVLQIEPGQVVMEFEMGGLPGDRPIDPTDPSRLEAGQTYVTVGGLPAILADYAPGDEEGTLRAVWTLSVPKELGVHYTVTATMEGPGLDDMKAQVQALVDSIRYDPPVPVLDPADGPAIAAKGLAEAQALDRGYDCFSAMPGATATAMITQLPGTSALSKPLPVTCAMTIDRSAIGLWKMTLTWSWTAASDRSAGELRWTIWLDPDGTVDTWVGEPGPSEIPYQGP